MAAEGCGKVAGWPRLVVKLPLDGRGWSRNGGSMAAEADLLAVFGKNGLQFGKKM